MSSAQDRAKALARELKEATQAARAAEVRAKQLSEALLQALAEARGEAEAARIVKEYPTGRYECAACGHSTLFTQPTRTLPACDNCGQSNWLGHEPTVTTYEPPPPKKYPAGMYQCTGCGVRTALAEDMDELSPCEICGAVELTP